MKFRRYAHPREWRTAYCRGAGGIRAATCADGSDIAIESMALYTRRDSAEYSAVQRNPARSVSCSGHDARARGLMAHLYKHSVHKR